MVRTPSTVKLVIIGLVGVFGVHAQDCTFSEDGKTYDVSTLASDTYYFVNSQNYASFKFFFNICKAISFGDSGSSAKCPIGETGSCEIQQTGGIDEVSEGYGKVSTAQMSYNQAGGDGQPQGGVLTYTGGVCARTQENNYQTKIFFTCDEDAKEPVAEMIEDNFWDCYVHIKFKTRAVCASVSDSFGSEEDVGMILCILAFVFAILYFGIGFGLLHRKGERGWDRVPNKEFWQSLPGLVKDGATFSKEKVKSWIEYIKARRSGGYNAL